MENFVDANGVRTWYEEIGDGPPVLFLHGGIVASAAYPHQRNGLSARHRVILPERRGHGRTPEVDGPASHWGPTGPDWPTRSVAFFGRMRQLFLTEPNITPEDLARITAPTLILGADRDIMALEDLLVQFRGIAGAQLAIVPGATHQLTFEKPDLVNELILAFLSADLTPAQGQTEA